MEELDILMLDSSDSDSENSDIEEIFLIHVFNNRQNLIGHRAEVYGAFNFNELSEHECKLNFRFEKQDILRLALALRIPEHFTTVGGHKTTCIEGLCILLRRLAYPNRLVDLEPLFGRSGPGLSEIANFVCDLIYNNFGHLLSHLRNLPWLNLDRLRTYSQAVHEKGGAIANCWGFIDGTTRAICRPTENQQAYYSGHKRYHCVKYQAVTCPDGIIVNLKGAYEGRKHDAAILRDSNLYAQLEECTVFENENFVLYGDKAYGIRELLLCPYPDRPNMPPQYQEFNLRMSGVRSAVEWGFGKVIAEFAFLDFKKNQKLLLQDIATMYMTAVILTNCHSCLYGNQTAQAFNVNPVELEEYLQ